MKKWFFNLSVKSKIVLSFCLVIIMFFILSTWSLLSLKKIDYTYSSFFNTSDSRLHIILDLKVNFSEIQRFNYIINRNYTDSESVKSSLENIKQNLDKINTDIENIINSLKSDKFNDPSKLNERIQDIEILENLIKNDYWNIVEKTTKAIDSNDMKKLRLLMEESDEIGSTINSEIDTLINLSKELNNDVILDVANTSNKTILFSFITSLILIILVIFISILISEIIVKPIKNLIKLSNKVSNGDFNVNLNSNYKDEISILSNDINGIVNIFKQMTDDITNITELMKSGSVNCKIDELKYKGAYKTTANKINEMKDSFFDDITAIFDSLSQYSDGNFSYNCKRFPGDKALIHENMDNFKRYLLDINNDITNLIENASLGNLEININENNYKGDWKKIILNLNKLVESIANPISDVSNVLNELSKANFSVKITNEYHGEFENMKNAINTTVDSLVLYINDISYILNKMAKQDLDITINQEYIGDFSEIKDALNLIINNFNNLINEISSSANQVATGAKSTADSSTALATGASQQANAVEELTSIINLISSQTKENSINIIKADDLTDKTKENAENGNAEMQNMLLAMEEINKASSNIATIINVIDDIAFQTNILALNAAVEAARAGQNGKGFAVVAEEVRNLASRSQKSAKETSELINISIEKAKQGMNIAKNTADELKIMVEEISEVTNIVTNIATAFKSQESLVEQVKLGINQISDVVNTNSAASEEAAASSEELASQSELFKEFVIKFNLKNN